MNALVALGLYTSLKLCEVFGYMECEWDNWDLEREEELKEILK